MDTNQLIDAYRRKRIVLILACSAPGLDDSRAEYIKRVSLELADLETALQDVDLDPISFAAMITGGAAATAVAVDLQASTTSADFFGTTEQRPLPSGKSRPSPKCSIMADGNNKADGQDRRRTDEVTKGQLIEATAVAGTWSDDVERQRKGT